jgi:hypothetical protein
MLEDREIERLKDEANRAPLKRLHRQRKEATPWPPLFVPCKL